MSLALRDPDSLCRSRARRKCGLRLATALCLGVAAAQAAAVTCTVSTPGVAFGGYDVYAAAPTLANGTLTLRCSLGAGENGSTPVPYKFSLSTGSSGSFAPRKMKSGANTLDYNLYTANTFGLVWGDGTGTTVTISGSMTLDDANPSRTVTRTVFGRIPALQDAAVASDYLDNVTVTVTY